MIQKAIGWAVLVWGLVYAVIILRNALHDRASFRQEKGRFVPLGLAELLVFFVATLSVSDFLLNTIMLRMFHLTDDKKLPGALIAAGLVPGSVIACSLLQVENPVDLMTLIPCAAGIALGFIVGGRYVRGLDGAKIKRIMGFALIGSMVALIIKMIVSAGTTGEATGLSLPKLCFAVVFSFFWGVVNTFGVPMKPAGTACFLILGMSPLSTLTLVLVMGSIGPLSGGAGVLKSGLYHQKLACAAALFGTLGALLGCLFAVSVSATLLNILILLVMVIAIISMFRG